MMMQDTMTPKERWLAVLRRETPDRVPMDYWGTWEASHIVISFLGVEDYWEMCERLHIDAVVSVGPKHIGPKLNQGCDFYGRGYQRINYDTGSYDEVFDHPLAGFSTAAELEDNYTWPTQDWFDYSVIPNQIKSKEQYPVRAVGYIAGKPTAEQIVSTTSDPAQIRLSANRDRVQANGLDLCYITVEVLDAEDRLRPTADNTIYFSINGPGKILAVGSSNPLSEESYIGNHRKAFRGRALVVVKSTSEPCEIRLSAHADGLEGTEIRIITEEENGKTP